MKKLISILILLGSVIPGTVLAEPVDDIRIRIQTGAFADQGSNAGFIFNLCPRRIVSGRATALAAWDSVGVRNDCLVLKCDDAGLLNYNAGDYEQIDLFGNLEDMGCRIDSRGKSLSELSFPEDFEFFGFYPDQNYFMEGETLWQGDDPGYDGWFLAGVEMIVNGEAVYRNPVVNRWIDIPHHGIDSFVGSDFAYPQGGDLYSPHSLENDLAIAFYVETRNQRNAGTSDLLYISMPNGYRPRREGSTTMVMNSLDTGTLVWIHTYEANADGPMLTNPTRSGIEINLDWGGYNDHERNGAASYGVTIPYGGGPYPVIDPRFRVEIAGDESWGPRKIKAYYFKPGDPEFLENQECWHREQVFDPRFWLSTNSREGDSSSPLPGYRFNMEQTVCPSLSTIDWGNGDDGAYAFGRR